MPKYRYKLRSEYISCHEIDAESEDKAKARIDEWLNALFLSTANGYCESRKYEELELIEASK